MQSEVKQRLVQFLAYLNIGQKAFAKSVGLSDGFVNAIRVSIQPKTLDKISVRYPELNTAWLLTGEGEMLRRTESQDQPTPKVSFTGGVPYYDVDFVGGFDLVTNDQTTNPAYNIDFLPYNKATCWCNITGHSMEPEINHGDIIALRKIEDFSFLPMGEIYAIVTANDMRTVKRLGVSDNPDNYRLIPTNKSPEYGVQELPKKMIRSVFEVMGCMKKF